MLDQTLRQYKDQILVPVATHVRTGIHPTTVTVIAFGVGIAAGIAVLLGAYWVALGLWAVNRILDGLDGTIARHTGKVSDLGGYIDVLLDHAIYAFIVIMLAISQGTTAGYLALAFLLGSYYVNGASWMFLSSLLEKRNQGAKATGEQTTITMPTGLVEGTETVVFYVLFLAVPVAMVPLFLLFGSLIVITIVQRLLWALKHVR